MNELPPSRSGAPEMFNRLAKRYDLINRVLSLWMDAGWRRMLARMADVQPGERVLDVATGTADLAMILAICQPRASVIGVDPSLGMLEIAQEKIDKQGLLGQIVLEEGKAELIPHPDRTFDVATIAFGIRNAVDPMLALREMQRVLRPNGRLFVLEFSIPRNPSIALGHRLYLRYVIPIVGGLLSGNFSAYRYLNRTIETFPSGETFLAMVRKAGFVEARQKELCLGAVSIYSARK